MSTLPIMLRGEAISALVVGGGRVGTRKALALLRAGARVTVIDPTPDERLVHAADSDSRLALVLRAYQHGDISDAQLVIAATTKREVNASVASDARAAHRLVNVADAPDDGSFATAAVHQQGALTIGVSAGGVPVAAARIRDAIADRFDARYATVLDALIALRTRLLRDKPAAWQSACDSLVADDFCARVERGDDALAREVAAWR